MHYKSRHLPDIEAQVKEKERTGVRQVAYKWQEKENDQNQEWSIRSRACELQGLFAW
jgi:hypothetical protein